MSFLLSVPVLLVVALTWLQCFALRTEEQCGPLVHYKVCCVVLCCLSHCDSKVWQAVYSTVLTVPASHTDWHTRSGPGVISASHTGAQAPPRSHTTPNYCCWTLPRCHVNTALLTSDYTIQSVCVAVFGVLNVCVLYVFVWCWVFSFFHFQRLVHILGLTICFAAIRK